MSDNAVIVLCVFLMFGGISSCAVGLKFAETQREVQTVAACVQAGKDWRKLHWYSEHECVTVAEAKP